MNAVANYDNGSTEVLTVNSIGEFLWQCCMCLMFVERRMRANGPTRLSRDISLMSSTV